MKIALIFLILFFFVYADEERFISSDNIVIDNTTGLIWEKNPNNELKTYKEANEYCINLGIKQYEKWRMPTIAELTTLSSKSSIKENTINIKEGFYWSSSAYLADETKVWLFDFQNEFSSKYYKNSNAYIICVHQ